MKRLGWALWCLLAGLGLAGCVAVGGGDVGSAAELAVAPDRQILVTFPDERRHRVPVADSVNYYRQRGGYSQSTWGVRLAQRLADDYGLRPLTQWPINALGVHCVVYALPATVSQQDILRRLAQDQRIDSVQPLQTYQTMAAAAGYSDPYFKLQTGLQAMRVAAAHQLATGREVQIALIDTGVDAAHPDLAAQISLQHNFVEARSPQTREDVHGTAVAGVIAAIANNQQGIVGVAPGAKLLALKACWPLLPLQPEAACNSLSLALALDRAIGLNVQIINLSLTGPADALVGRLLQKALAAGIVVVAAADSTAGEIAFPASAPGVIAVQAAGRQSGGIAAPGQNVLTTLPNGAYSFLSGSSFAAAHVSGIVALLLELNPRLDAAHIAALLLAAMPAPAAAEAGALLDMCALLANVGAPASCGNPLALLTP